MDRSVNPRDVAMQLIENGMVDPLTMLQAEKDMMAANLRLEAAYHAIGGASDYV